MGCRKTWILGAALCGALLCGANSQAGTIDFLATGDFTSTGTPTFTNGPASVTYTSAISSAVVPPATNINLGTFTAASTSASTTPVVDTFTLTVTDTTPGSAGGSISFIGSMSGTISSGTSNASVVFSSPLSQTLDGFVFTIVSADGGHVGTVNLNAPTTNGGVSTISATVDAVVPEPTSIALLGLALPALAGLAYRRVRR
jgi:PEP-CTERM motif